MSELDKECSCSKLLMSEVDFARVGAVRWQRCHLFVEGRGAAAAIMQ
jgi:hypothetical protein